MATEVVLDSSALLALLKRRAGRGRRGRATAQLGHEHGQHLRGNGPSSRKPVSASATSGWRSAGSYWT